MQRLALALFCALSWHGLLLLMPWVETTPVAPRLTGEQSIKISLDACPAPEPPTDHSQPESETQTKPPESQVEKPDLIEEPPEPVERNRLLPQVVQPILQKKKPRHKTQPVITSKTVEDTTIKRPTTTIGAPEKTPQVVMASPLYHQNPKPIYPVLARKRGWEGTVIFRVWVLKDGSPSKISLYQTSGYKVLDRAAINALKRWHFLPGTLDSIPQESEVLVPVHFLLR